MLKLVVLYLIVLYLVVLYLVFYVMQNCSFNLSFYLR